MDQIANNAIPITANTEEKTNDKSSGLAPKIKDSISNEIRNRKTVTYLPISFILASFIPLFRPIFLSAVFMMNLNDNRIETTINVLINSSLYDVKKSFIL